MFKCHVPQAWNYRSAKNVQVYIYRFTTPCRSSLLLSPRWAAVRQRIKIEGAQEGWNCYLPGRRGVFQTQSKSSSHTTDHTPSPKSIKVWIHYHQKYLIHVLIDALISRVLIDVSTSSHKFGHQFIAFELANSNANAEVQQ